MLSIHRPYTWFLNFLIQKSIGIIFVWWVVHRSDMVAPDEKNYNNI
jgi:hypothetical protein